MSDRNQVLFAHIMVIIKEGNRVKWGNRSNHSSLVQKERQDARSQIFQIKISILRDELLFRKLTSKPLATFTNK